MKAVPSSSNSNYQLNSCRPSMPNSMGQSTNEDKAGLCSFGMKFTVLEKRLTAKDVIVCEGLPTTVIMKAVPSSCDSNY
jgi:hypothetical protein